MTHSFRIGRKRVAYRNRWVRTAQWRLERAAGRALFATSGDPTESDPSVAGMRTDGAANTNLVSHGGRMLALEEGHGPIEIDAATLETIGAWDFAGALPRNMTAHPKIDPATGEMWSFAIQSNWTVTRMLRMAQFPPNRDEIRGWFEDHEREWRESEAYRFAVELAGKFVGLVDVDEIDGDWGDLGYWLEPAAWGAGYATEAAQAVVRFAFDDVGLVGLRSGHAGDNPASGRVLRKLGFQQIDMVRATSRSRAETIQQSRYVLHRPPGGLRELLHRAGTPA